jgi:hypothetical protein
VRIRADPVRLPRPADVVSMLHDSQSRVASRAHGHVFVVRLILNLSWCDGFMCIVEEVQ